jgi:hypothetical protein
VPSQQITIFLAIVRPRVWKVIPQEKRPLSTSLWIVRVSPLPIIPNVDLPYRMDFPECRAQTTIDHVLVLALDEKRNPIH